MEAAGLVRRCARGEGGGGMVEEAMFKRSSQKADDRVGTSEVCGRVSDRPGVVVVAYDSPYGQLTLQTTS